MELAGALVLDAETLFDLVKGGDRQAVPLRMMVIATNAGGQAMTVSRDTVVLGVRGSATGMAQVALGDVALYGAGNYGVDDPNVIMRWQSAPNENFHPCRFRLHSGDTIVFRSSVAAQVCSLLCT